MLRSDFNCSLPRCSLSSRLAKPLEYRQESGNHGTVWPRCDSRHSRAPVWRQTEPPSTGSGRFPAADSGQGFLRRIPAALLANYAPAAGSALDCGTCREKQTRLRKRNEVINLQVSCAVDRMGLRVHHAHAASIELLQTLCVKNRMCFGLFFTHC